MFWLLLVLLASGCGLLPQPKERVDCWDDADEVAGKRLEKECYGKLTSECEAWPDIEAELKRNQENCK